MDRLQRRFLLAAVVCLLLAAALIAIAWSGMSHAADEAVIRAVHGKGGEIAEGAMRAATFVGDGWPRSLLAAAFIVFLLVRRYARAASYILYTAIGIAALNAWVLKAFIKRPRPELVERLIDVDQSWSLPSGHAANSAAVYGAIALIAATIWWRRAQRRLIWTGAAFVVLMVGVSRVWLGVHWPSDVLAGWLVGAAWALGLAALLKPVQARVHMTD